jgi:hypothetical protein
MIDGKLDLIEPDCPTCSRSMMLSRIEPLVGQIGVERRTFECRWCPSTEHYVVETAGPVSPGTEAALLFKAALRSIRRSPLQ